MCQGSLCARRWVRASNTHHTESLSLCSSLSHSPTFLCLPCCANSLSFPSSINLYSFQHSPSFPTDIVSSFLQYGSCMQEWLVGTLGIVAGGMIVMDAYLSVIRALTQMCQMPMLRSLKFSWTLQSFFLLVEHVWVGARMYTCIYVIRCVHWCGRRFAVCQAPLINLHFHVLTYYFKHWRCKSQLKRYITLCLVNLNLHNNTVQLQEIIKPQNQLSQRTAVKINHGHKKA